MATPKNPMNAKLAGQIAPLPGVPHFAVKMPMAPKQRQNLLNIRVSPLKRLTAQEKPVKPDKSDPF